MEETLKTYPFVITCGTELGNVEELIGVRRACFIVISKNETVIFTLKEQANWVLFQLKREGKGAAKTSSFPNSS